VNNLDDEFKIRQFVEGDTGISGGTEWRIIKGQKNNGDDLILQLRTDGGKWDAVKMEVAFLLNDFLYQNEERLYPPSRGFMGGKKFYKAAMFAIKDGYEAASEAVKQERLNKRSPNMTPGWAEIDLSTIPFTKELP